MNLVFSDIFKESEIFRRISKEAVRIISFLNGLGSPAVPVCDSCKKPSQGSLAQEEISIPDLLTLFSMKNSQQQSLLCIQKSSWNDEPFT
ncbi:9310_t:CDS:2, partial [Rhizophagus irregularis]